MIRVTIKNYDTKEDIARFDFCPKAKDKSGLSAALKYVEKKQEEEDILKLGKTGRIISDGFGLGIQNLYTQGKCQSTYPQDDTKWSSASREPNEIKIWDSTTAVGTGLRISAFSYDCGIVLNTGKKLNSLWGIQTLPGYMTKLTSRTIHSGNLRNAKVFDTPAKLLKTVEKFYTTLSYMVREYGYQFSVEYANNMFREDVNNLPTKKKEKWDAEMETLKKKLEELNNITDEPEDTVYYTPAAKMLAEWELNGHEGEKPCELEKNDFVQEAVMRMKKMHIAQRIIDDFIQSGYITMSVTDGNTARYIKLDSTAEDAVKQVRNLDCYPYLVLNTPGAYGLGGNLTDVLSVSSNPSEWEDERCSRDGYIMSFCLSPATFGDVEGGTIQLEKINEGVMRIV